MEIRNDMAANIRKKKQCRKMEPNPSMHRAVHDNPLFSNEIWNFICVSIIYINTPSKVSRTGIIIDNLQWHKISYLHSQLQNYSGFIPSECWENAIGQIEDFEDVFRYLSNFQDWSPAECSLHLECNLTVMWHAKHRRHPDCYHWQRGKLTASLKRTSLYIYTHWDENWQCRWK
jgi:hypothetical protein